MTMQLYKKLVSEFVALKSISTNPDFLPEIAKTVKWLKNTFESHGFVVTVYSGKETNPVVFASFDAKVKETVLVYGHYDVQPATTQGWDSDPFTLTEHQDKWVARGVVDNKGQVAIHMATVFALIKEGKLKYNVKFLIEGNEETSNAELPELIEHERQKFAADHIIVSDGEIVGDKPVIDVSLRGGFNLRVVFKTAKNNLHSGIYGGAVPSATWELVSFLSKIYDSQHSIAIPNYYEHVDAITTAERKNNELLKKDAQNLLDHAGLKALVAEPDNDFFTQTGLRPTIQITGLRAGYIDTGFANIVPATAEARLNFRIVTSQTPEEALNKFTKFAQETIPSYVDFELEPVGLHAPVKADISAPIFKHVQELLQKSHGHKPLLKNVGGAIPFVADVKKILGVDALSVSLCNEDCNMHGNNENFKIDLIEKGLAFSHSFFSS